MKLFFGATPRPTSEVGFLVAGDSDNLYQYFVEYGSGNGGFSDITLTDAVGRSVPVSTLDIELLIEALEYVLDTKEYLEDLEVVHTNITDPEVHTIITKEI
jgi:hypothetical protein